MSAEELVYYPPYGFHFKVNFEGEGMSAETSFSEVSGLSVEIPVEEITEGGELRFRHKLPLAAKYNNLVLKRGLVVNSALRKWISDAVENFEFSPLSVKIELLNKDEKGGETPLMAWSVNNARPVKWEVTSFDAQKNDLVIETLELAFDFFKRIA